MLSKTALFSSCFVEEFFCVSSNEIQLVLKIDNLLSIKTKLVIVTMCKMFCIYFTDNFVLISKSIGIHSMHKPKS
ncbi:hypothetical protein BpHYR1_043971 [Brachionus plicatilis]|uniref:Uncharacterized protein n=1 Tax=Brachionus plicatilis TaxID=10195 RepID=A0A3M7S1U2_BRAPC|nr:hypothetical protein BpHYR1_043971 [Brachionus plicatilis]